MPATGRRATPSRVPTRATAPPRAPAPPLGHERREVHRQRDDEEPPIGAQQRREGHLPREAGEELERQADAHQGEQPSEPPPRPGLHRTSSPSGRKVYPADRASAMIPGSAAAVRRRSPPGS